MKICANWCIKDEAKRIEASLRSLVPYVDSAVIVDSGSTDNTLEIVDKVRQEYPHIILPTLHVDIGPDKNMSISRNMGLQNMPKDSHWYMYPAGDEVYDDSVKNLRSVLENIPPNYVWMFTWFRHWDIDETTKQYIRRYPSTEPYYTINGDPRVLGTPGACRVLPGMLWEGIWNRERILYPGIGSYFRYVYPQVGNPYIYMNANIWCDHWGWADEKRSWKGQEYVRLAALETQGKYPHPRG